MKPACLAFVFALSLTATVASAPNDTTFTYQGELQQNGSPVNGAFDIEFELWNAATGGNRIGNEIENDELPVVNGRFTVELDFGANAFDNSDRWLEIKVNGTELTPRQPVTRAPYAIQTRGIFVNNAGDVGIGTASPNYRLHVETYEDDAAILGHAINSSLDHIAIGVQGSADGPFLTIGVQGSADGPVGRGVYGRGATGVSGQATAGDGTGVEGTSFNGTGVEGYCANGTGVNGIAAGFNGINYGVRGRSESTSGFDFYAAGAGEDYGSSSSRRWKSNIEAIDQPLEKISQLRGVYFDWDQEHGGHHDIGMIAEEVGKVLPEIVQYEENGVDAIGMDYSKMTPLLVQAVNALRAEKDSEIQVLRAEKDDEIAALHKRIAALERLLTKPDSILMEADR